MSIKQNRPITRDAARSAWPISKSESRNTRGGGRKEEKEEEEEERRDGKSGGKELEGGSNAEIKANEPIRRGNENSSKGSLYS